MEADMGTVRTNSSGQDTFYSVVGSASVQGTGQEVSQQGSSIEQTANAMALAWQKKIEVTTANYLQQASAMLEEGGPILPGPYQTWNVILAGPFQAIGGVTFAPQKIIEQDEDAFFLAAFWRNPAPPVFANLLMAGHTVQYWGETVNLTSVTNGPDLPVAAGAPNSFVLNASPVTVRALLAPGGTFSGGSPNKPNLYEMTLTARVPANPVFTAFSTWHFDPDVELPMPGLPGVPGGFQHDIPARFLVYKKP
jgi:hypothetical protein